MARKTKEDAQETHELLLDAAERVFQEKGVAHSTLNDVALAAGMTRGAIYWHFKDKHALFHAMCDRALLPTEALMNEIANTSSDDALEALRKMMQQMLYQVAGNPRQRVVFDIMFHRCEKNQEMAFFVDELAARQECLLQLEAIMHKAIEQGKLPANTDARMAMLAMHSYLIGLIHQWLLDPSAYDLQSRGAMMMEIFIAGLIAKPPLRESD